VSIIKIDLSRKTDFFETGLLFTDKVGRKFFFGITRELPDKVVSYIVERLIKDGIRFVISSEYSLQFQSNKLMLQFYPPGVSVTNSRSRLPFMPYQEAIYTLSSEEKVAGQYALNSLESAVSFLNTLGYSCSKKALKEYVSTLKYGNQQQKMALCHLDDLIQLDSALLKTDIDEVEEAAPYTCFGFNLNFR
jgi:hypothetical protein